MMNNRPQIEEPAYWENQLTTYFNRFSSQFYMRLDRQGEILTFCKSKAKISCREYLAAVTYGESPISAFNYAEKLLMDAIITLKKEHLQEVLILNFNNYYTLLVTCNRTRQALTELYSLCEPYYDALRYDTSRSLNNLERKIIPFMASYIYSNTFGKYNFAHLRAFYEMAEKDI